MNKEWILKKRKSRDILTQLLINRGITAREERQMFLQPDYKRDLADPFLMKGMKKAVKRIEKALNLREKIGIFGDYDVDGVCGSTILYEFLERFGVTPFFETYLPDRQKDGYGLNREGLAYFKKQGVSLVITVDCGVTDEEEIAWAQEKGIDVIVTDHHEVSQKLPPAYAVINPKQKGEKFPFSGLSGTGVAFKLAQALRRSLNNEKISEAWEKWLLDLVAFATVADQMPLVSENRVLVKYGLIVLRKTKRLGLRELIRAAKISSDVISTEDLLYRLAPRINAASRMNHALKAFKLLITKDIKEARLLANEIDKANSERQRIVLKTMKEVEEQISSHYEEVMNEKIIFEGGLSWTPGICGLVANKIMERYGYPTFIASIGKNVVKGSVRSFPPFSVVLAMKNAKELLSEWGGHHQAGGFSLPLKNLAAFKEKIKEQVVLQGGKEIVPALEIDAKLETNQINLETYEVQEKLEPFGKGNPEPLFLLENATIYRLRKVGANGDHFKLVILKEGRFFDAIYFGGAAERELKEGNTIDAVFNLKRSLWNFATRVELNIIDLHVVL